MTVAVKGRLGDRLLSKGLVSKEQLDVALKEQQRAHRPLGEILISLAFVSQESITRLVAEDLGCAYLSATEVDPDPLLVSALDPTFVRDTLSFPVRMQGGSLLVLMADPDDTERVSQVRNRFPYPLEIALTTESDILWLLAHHVRGQTARTAQLFAEIAAEDAGADLPVEKITQAVLLDGIYRGATDVHIEPDARVTRVRYRIDGILQPGENLPTQVTSGVVSRIKIMSGLDISERRRPQDGRIRFTFDDRSVDLRVSIMPTTDGENVVIRILDKSGTSGKLHALGIAPEQVRALQTIATRSHGLFLVTGPTGSGKTTTLYSLLGEVDAMGRNVATIEDPVEYRLPLLRQSQVDPAIGFGFQEGLRALLRQDPDVVLVGEIRDSETAQMAIKASMTGHLVFSTLHTNTALGAIPRLVDIGIDPYLIEDSLIGVMAQRLVRRVCRSCARPAELDEHELRWLGGEAGQPMTAVGCERCRATGYSGRTVISELFLPDDVSAEAIRGGADISLLKQLTAASGMSTMADDGRAKVRAGITTRAEVERVNRSHRLDVEEREACLLRKTL
ncbi:MAG: Flp pilus assembly complex ATPase component TadA [Planctomycetes bacterium]|nr:Flp pilus assembly complex ATPase component TadA [Planctomycetota bacterium]